MRQAITSILKAICNNSVALADGEKAASKPTDPMLPLSANELRQVVGGDETLPKGGWKAV